MVLDGAMGTMLQQQGLRGNNDEYSLTRPEVVGGIHRQYLEAGVDIITTNTFSAQRISQQEYGLTDRVADLNRASVRLAREAADEYTRLTPDRPRYVAGCVGPTGKMLSMSEDADDPAARSLTFDELESAYLEQIRVLVEEGVDIVLVETVFDTLNAKAAISAYMKVADEAVAGGNGKPELILSMTVSDASGRTLSGQTVPAFVTSVLHADPLAIGLNCGLGALGLLPWLRQLSAAAPCFVSCHPNAGLPDADGHYVQTPEEYVGQVAGFLDERLVNIVGGCCGTTPSHLKALTDYLAQHSAEVRIPVTPEEATRLAGLEAYAYRRNHFVRVGERCNVAGSRKFLRLIGDKHYNEALEIARKQVDDGAEVIDVNMDDGLLDAVHEMTTFLNLLAADPDICRVPVMVDSSRFEVIEAGLKCLQGKGVVNSISLKPGEAEFVRQARVVRRLGAAVVVMCFDEEGQATDYARRIAICRRAYTLLTEQVGFDPHDIIFDPNVLTIATGMAEHDDYALDYIRATRWIRDNLPGARVSGGLSNLSFAFRGNNYLRECMHSVFLHFAISRGMNMAILNPATAVRYETIPAELRLAITEVILNTSHEASEHLTEVAQQLSSSGSASGGAASAPAGNQISTSKSTTPAATSASAPAATSASTSASASTGTSEPVQSSLTPAETARRCLMRGTGAGLEESLQALLDEGKAPVDIISGPLMSAMDEVGKLFGEGKMFLPQVVKTARTMKQAVAFLQPYIEKERQGDALASTKAGRIVIATVKGDVHDIGKNIVAVVLACNNFEVIDLGVMVPPEEIVRQAIEQKADIVCLSGLITPSLEEMRQVAIQMQQAGLRIPLMVGGATTSPRHTALRIAPCYDGPVFHVRDAAQNPALALQLLDPARHDALVAELRAQQAALVCPSSPADEGTVPVSELLPLIDWQYFYWAWRTKADSAVGEELKRDALRLLEELAAAPDGKYDTHYVQRFYPACGLPDREALQVRLADGATLLLPTPRQTHDSPAYREAVQQGVPYRLKSLADYVATEAQQSEAVLAGRPLPDYMTHVGAFAATVGRTFAERLEHLKAERGGGDYDVLLLQTVGDRLAEATSEYISRRMQQQKGWQGIRPAVGYPSWPDQRNIFLLARMVDMERLGITLTENGAMYPQASVCGLYLGNPEAEYFAI